MKREEPFVGPVPYDEQDRQFFSGRGVELVNLQRHLKDDRLVLLSAPSGFGKTSFVRAGLVPDLRRRRAEAVDRGTPETDAAVVVVRDWLARAGASADELLGEAVEGGVRLMRAVANHYEFERPSILDDWAKLNLDPPSPPDAFRYICRLCERVRGGLILVLDQFEETLQGPAERSDEMCDLLARLYRARPRDLWLLVSFRREFLGSFERLRTVLGSLEPFSIPLEEMRAATLHDALKKAAEVAGAVVEQYEPAGALPYADVLDELITASAQVSPPARRPPRRLGIARRAVPPLRTETAPGLRLLQLQAALRELYRFAVGRHKEGQIRLGRNTLQELMGAAGLQRQESLPGSASVTQPLGTELLTVALERYIDQDVLRVSRRPDGPLAGTLQQRRTAAKMANLFSSSTLKVSVPASRLVALAFEEEWDVLNTTWQVIEDALEGMYEFGNGEEVRRRLRELPVDEPGLAEDVPPEDGVLSGPDRNTRSVLDTAVQLVQLVGRTLRRLERGNLIRRKPGIGDDSVFYELVHDGFGSAFDDWARDVEQDPRYTLAAIVAQQGETFDWERLAGAVHDVCWRGCWVGPPRPRKELLIKSATFAQCDLQATLFENCRFEGGEFRECNLAGVVFERCSFVGTRFTKCHGGGLQFNGGKLTQVEFSGCRQFQQLLWGRTLPVRVDDVSFKDCNLRQWDSERIDLLGPLRLANTTVELSHLGSDADRIVAHACRFYVCDLVPALADRIAADTTNVIEPRPEATRPAAKTTLM